MLNKTFIEQLYESFIWDASLIKEAQIVKSKIRRAFYIFVKSPIFNSIILFLIKNSGEVLQWQVEKQSMDMQIQETTFKWIRYVPVAKAHNSFAYALFEL